MSSIKTTATFASVPIYKTGNYQNRPTQLPPTPTSSNSSSTLEKGKGRDLTFVPDHSQKYGSLGSSTPYFDNVVESRPVTPSQTTIGSNDDDEGLYLLWTQQLLRERGFAPSPCTPDEYSKRDDDDSSISDMSSVSSGEDDEDREDFMKINQYIAEQRKFFDPAPSSNYAYSHRASMISRYSMTAESSTAVEEQDENITPIARKNPISTFFASCFSSCL